MAAPTEWTITTIKEHFETLLAGVKDGSAADNRLLTERFNASQEALKQQAVEYERRLTALNGEAGRLTAANALNVSREVYDNDKKTDEEWKRRMESQIGETVSDPEFRAYKDSTSTALTLQAGKREGVGVTGQTVLAIVLGLAAVIAIIAGVAAFMTSRTLPTTIYLQPPASLPDQTKR